MFSFVSGTYNQYVHVYHVYISMYVCLDVSISGRAVCALLGPERKLARFYILSPSCGGNGFAGNISNAEDIIDRVLAFVA